MSVSIIIPVYNAKPYLRQCLDSVIQQTYGDLEIIIVDDGSTDGSGEICDEYKEQNDLVRVIHQNNRGLSAARNTGLDIATGEFIMFLDSDDWLETVAIERMNNAVSDADIVVCEYLVERLHGRNNKSNEAQLIERSQGDNILRDYLRGERDRKRCVE